MGGASAIGGIVGQMAAGGEKEDSNNAFNDSLAAWTSLAAPDIEKMRLALEDYQSTGVMTPEMQQAINLGQTAMQDISTDPRLKNSQMSALEQMSGIANGQPGAADMAGFELSRQNAAGEMQAKNNQVLQEMQQRGQAGSGAELLAKLKNNQSGADMLQKAQLEQAQAMQQARMQALAQQGSMSTNIRGQDYDEQANLAKAKDAISAFNTQNQQNVSNANVGAKNQAQASNLANQQQIANQNTMTHNSQQQFNKGLEQQNFNNQLNMAAGKSNAYAAKGARQAQNAAQTAQMYQQAGESADEMGKSAMSMFGGAMMSDASKKKSIKPDSNEIQDLMDKLNSYSFDYEDPAAHGEGKHHGIMAQDLEKSNAGKSLIMDTPEGKMVDTKKAAMTALSGISQLNKRLNNIEGKNG